MPHTLRRILITGASGFVGQHLQPILRAALPDSTLLTPGFDVTDRDATHAAIRDAMPDACVHLAGIAAIPAARRDPDRAWQVNLHGTLNLAHAVMQSAPDCHFLFVSSADCYGGSFRAGHPLDEAAPLSPMNTYAATKAAADLALGALAAEGLKAIRLRPFNHTGPGQTENYVIPAFARQIARIEAGLQEPVLHVGALDPSRDFLDVRDVCAAYAACLRRAADLPAGTVLNIASGTPRRIGDVLQSLLDTAGVHARIATDAARLRPSDIPIACGDAGRAHALLGWSPATPWQQTLRDVLNDWRRRVACEAPA